MMISCIRYLSKGINITFSLPWFQTYSASQSLTIAEIMVGKGIESNVQEVRTDKKMLRTRSVLDANFVQLKDVYDSVKGWQIYHIQFFFWKKKKKMKNIRFLILPKMLADSYPVPI